MSADNYERVNKVRHLPGKYWVDTVFASDEDWEDPHEKLVRLVREGRTPYFFNSLDEAMEHAQSEYSEYGVICSFDTKVVDTSEG